MSQYPVKKDDFPWWLVAAVVIGVVSAVTIATSDVYTQILGTLVKGLWVTLFVTIVAFAMASALGLFIALLGLSNSKVLRQVSRFYVEIIRGLPILVLLFWIAFVGAPAFVVAWNWVTMPLQSTGLIEPMQVRDFSLLWRAIIALTIAYSSFIAEIFRAGIQAVDVGQIEAAKALGLSRY